MRDVGNLQQQRFERFAELARAGFQRLDLLLEPGVFFDEGLRFVATPFAHELADLAGERVLSVPRLLQLGQRPTMFGVEGEHAIDQFRIAEAFRANGFTDAIGLLTNALQIQHGWFRGTTDDFRGA